MDNNKKQDLRTTLKLLRDNLHNTIQSFKIFGGKEERNTDDQSRNSEQTKSRESSLEEKQLVSLGGSYFESPDSTKSHQCKTIISTDDLSQRNAGSVSLYRASSETLTKKISPSQTLKELSTSVPWMTVSNTSTWSSGQASVLSPTSKINSIKVLNVSIGGNQCKASETLTASDNLSIPTQFLEELKEIAPDSVSQPLSYESEESHIRTQDLDLDESYQFINNISTYFNDGFRKVDYVLVCNKRNLMILETYLNKIRLDKLNLEMEESKIYSHLQFVKIHASESFLCKIEERLPVCWRFRNAQHKREKKSIIPFANTVLQKPDQRNVIIQRAPQLTKQPKKFEIMDAERIMAVHKLLSETKFGNRVHEFGLKKLVDNKMLVCAFPLHDKMLEWSKVGLLSDRQLLRRFWANYRCLFKVQPIQLINNYFGNEIAFYFVWLGFHTAVLFPPIVLGFLVLCYGLATMNNENLNVQSYDILNSDIRLCPICTYEKCFYNVLKDSFNISRFNYILDNINTAIFNIVMSFWGVVCLMMWRRKEKFFKTAWNLSDVIVEDEKRANFYTIEGRADLQTIDDIESYKKDQTNWYFIFSLLVTLASSLAIIYIMIELLVVKTSIIQWYGRSKQSDANNLQVMSNEVNSAIVWSSISAIVIMILDCITPMITLWLTNLENPKTEAEFEKSYIWKLFVLTFVSNYTIPIYLAFIRGSFYIPSSDNKNGGNSKFSYIRNDTCDPSGCLAYLACWITINLALKVARSIFVDSTAPGFAIAFKNLCQAYHFPTHLEHSYALVSYEKTELIQSYLENVITYGFVLFFVSAFPLIPLLVCIAHAIKIRSYAIKLIKYEKRPAPCVSPGIQIWNKILEVMTYLGIAVHVFVLAFSTEIIPKILYLFNRNVNSKNYLQSKLTVFHFKNKTLNDDQVSSCQYLGYRNKTTLEHSPMFYEIVGGRLVFALIIEHLVIIFIWICSYSTRDMPPEIKKPKDVQEKL